MSLLIAIVISIAPVQIYAQTSSFNPEEIRIKLDSISTVYNIPSIGYSIATSDGVLTSGATGFANVEEELPAGSQTVYRVGSVTKTGSTGKFVGNSKYVYFSLKK